MTPAEIEEAAELLATSRRHRLRVGWLPGALRPRDEASAYAVQFAAHERLAAERGPRAGWKIGCTTPVMQQVVGLPSPCAGGMFARTILPSPAGLPLDSTFRAGVECEIAVRLGSDIPAGRHDRASVAPHVGTVMAAMEVVDDRYVDYRKLDAPALIADDFFHVACVHGPEATDWRDLDLAKLVGRTSIGGAEYGRGVGADVMGHPFEALAWLANRMAEYGRTLRAGEVVMLGSLVGTRWIDRPARAVIEVEGLGRAACDFA
jgi:2-oxo-3-hexenedioate decarboxylase/2-keto-4-pentenoate hydratase